MATFADLKSKRSGRDGPVSQNDSTSSSDSTAASSKLNDDSKDVDRSVSNSDSIADSSSAESSAGTSLYKLDANLLEIRQTPHAGRSLFVKKSVSPGMVLLSRKPHIALLDKANLSALCSNCMSEDRSLKNLQRCSGCKTVYYCSNECQKAQWKSHLHKLECSKLREWSESARLAGRPELQQIPDTPVRAIGHLLALRQHMPTEWWEEVQSLAGSPRALTATEQEQQGSLALAVSQYLGLTNPSTLISTLFPEHAEDPKGLTSLLLSMVDKFGINSFSLTQPDLSNIGVAICPAVALINHSCEPNCAVVFPDGPDKEMKVIAFKRIAAGEELLSSYLDLTMPLHKRQLELREQYKFECLCSICEKGRKGDDLRRSVRCSRSSCSGYVPLPGLAEMIGTKDLKCVSCGTTRKVCLSDEDAPRDGVVYAIEKADALLDQLSKQLYDALTPKQMKALSTSLQLCNDKHHLTPFSHPLLVLHRHILERTLANTQSNGSAAVSPSYKLARRTCYEVLAGLDRIYPFGHPVRAVQRVVYARLLGVSADNDNDDESLNGQGAGSGQSQATSIPGLMAAYEATRSALAECETAFGRGGKLATGVKEELVRLERDIGWRQTAQRQARERGYR